MNPEKALSDAEQALRPDTFRDMCEDLRLLAKVCRQGLGADRRDPEA